MLRFSVIDANGNTSTCEKQVTVGYKTRYYDQARNPVRVSPKVFLDGPYDNVSGAMTSDLNSSLIPDAQPYIDTSNYPGSSGDGDMEFEPSVVLNNSFFVGRPEIVDWVIVDLLKFIPGSKKNGGDALTELMHRKVGFVKEDGTVVDIDGVSPVTFVGVDVDPDTQENDDYHIAIRHRNHLSIMSKNKQILTASNIDDPSIFSYDFTSANQAYGNLPMIEDSGVYLMRGGDAGTLGSPNAHGSVTSFDFQKWLAMNGQPSSYNDADFNMDKNFTSFDYLTVWLNSNGYSTQVPPLINPTSSAYRDNSDQHEYLASVAEGRSRVKGKLDVERDDVNGLDIKLQLTAEDDFALGLATFQIQYDTDELRFSNSPSRGEDSDYIFFSHGSSNYESTVTHTLPGLLSINIFLKEKGRGDVVERRQYRDAVKIKMEELRRSDVSNIRLVKCEVFDEDYNLLIESCRGFDMSDEIVSFNSIADYESDLGPIHLKGAYPNPFNPLSRISFRIDREQDVTVDLYDETGRKIQTIFEGVLQAHTDHEFTIDGSSLSSGMYFYRVFGNDFNEVRRVTLLK